MIFAFGVLGSVASVVGLFLPAKGWRQRAVHVAYGLVVIVLAYFVATYQMRIDRVNSIERAARRMVTDRDMNYTHSGFVHAALSFLEKNKDLYPDTYQRALRMSENFSFDKPDSDSEMISLSSTMEGILRGLMIIDSES